MAVVAVFSPAGSSCFTLATVGVIGNVLTGTCRVSAVTTLVSAFTCSKCVRAGNFFDNSVFTLLEVLGEVVTLVTVGTKAAVGGAVTSSEHNEEVSFYSTDHI